MKNLYLPTTPALEAAYAVAPDPPLVAMRLETLMMQPGEGVSQLAQGTKGEKLWLTMRTEFCMLAYQHGGHQVGFKNVAQFLL